MVECFGQHQEGSECYQQLPMRGESDDHEEWRQEQHKEQEEDGAVDLCTQFGWRLSLGKCRQC